MPFNDVSVSKLVFSNSVTVILEDLLKADRRPVCRNRRRMRRASRWRGASRRSQTNANRRE